MGEWAAPRDPATSARMRRQRRRDTQAELAVRRCLHSMGFRYRLHVAVPGRARRTIDVAFPGPRVAVFVDGCFWHACPDHASWPKDNATVWQAKLEANVARDRQTDQVLREHGWEVVRIWEHEVPEEAARRVADVVRRRAIH